MKQGAILKWGSGVRAISPARIIDFKWGLP